jgi:hypothetical protein
VICFQEISRRFPTFSALDSTYDLKFLAAEKH